MEDINYFEYEKIEVGHLFNFEEILNFQMLHEVQVMRGGDYQFNCWIDGKCYANSLTFMHALVIGIIQYKKQKVD